MADRQGPGGPCGPHRRVTLFSTDALGLRRPGFEECPDLCGPSRLVVATSGTKTPGVHGR